MAGANKAMVSVLCKRFALDPKKIPSEQIEGCDIVSLFSYILSQTDVALKNQDEIMKWVRFAKDFSSEAGDCLGTLKALDEDLNQRSVLLGDGSKPSEADIVVFCAIHSFVIQLSNAEMQKFTNLTRWMDYIQNKEDFLGALEMIKVNKPQFEYFCYENVEKIDADLTTKKVTEDAKTTNKSEVKKNLKQGVSEAPVADKTPEQSTKVKSVKKPTEKEPAEKETEASITILNIQVGVIRKAWKHPSADSLLVEEIDLGDGNLRQVVSGLAKYFSPDELSNRRVVLISNVKPGKLRDVMSAGLVLCASNQDHTVVEPLIPPEGAIPGERVVFSGYEGKPEDVLNPKKKQLEKITPHLYTDDKGVATFKGVPFMTSAGPCTSSVPNASVK